MPIVPIAAAALPNGKVLMWSTDQQNGYGPSLIWTYTALYDPTTGQNSSRLVTKTGHNMVRPREEMITNTSYTSPRQNNLFHYKCISRHQLGLLACVRSHMYEAETDCVDMSTWRDNGLFVQQMVVNRRCPGLCYYLGIIDSGNTPLGLLSALQTALLTALRTRISRMCFQTAILPKRRPLWAMATWMTMPIFLFSYWN